MGYNLKIIFKNCESLGCTPETYSVCQLLFSHSVMWLFATPWTAAHQTSPSFTISQFAQTHVHWVDNAIHSLPPPSLLTLNLSQHQGLFQWVNFSHQVAKVLEFQLQNQSFQWTPRTDLLQDGLVGSPCSPRDSQDSSPIPQLKSFNSSVLSDHYGPDLTSIHDYRKTIALTIWTFASKVMSLLFSMLFRFVIAFLGQGARPLAWSLENTMYSFLSAVSTY